MDQNSLESGCHLSLKRTYYKIDTTERNDKDQNSTD